MSNYRRDKEFSASRNASSGYYSNNCQRKEEAYRFRYDTNYAPSNNYNYYHDRECDLLKRGRYGYKHHFESVSHSHDAPASGRQNYELAPSKRDIHKTPSFEMHQKQKHRRLLNSEQKQHPCRRDYVHEDYYEYRQPNEKNSSHILNHENEVARKVRQPSSSSSLFLSDQRLCPEEKKICSSATQSTDERLYRDEAQTLHVYGVQCETAVLDKKYESAVASECERSNCFEKMNHSAHKMSDLKDNVINERSSQCANYENSVVQPTSTLDAPIHFELELTKKKNSTQEKLRDEKCAEELLRECSAANPKNHVQLDTPSKRKNNDSVIVKTTEHLSSSLVEALIPKIPKRRDITMQHQNSSLRFNSMNQISALPTSETVVTSTSLNQNGIAAASLHEQCHRKGDLQLLSCHKQQQQQQSGSSQQPSTAIPEPLNKKQKTFCKEKASDQETTERLAQQMSHRRTCHKHQWDSASLVNSPKLQTQGDNNDFNEITKSGSSRRKSFHTKNTVYKRRQSKVIDTTSPSSSDTANDDDNYDEDDNDDDDDDIGLRRSNKKLTNGKSNTSNTRRALRVVMDSDESDSHQKIPKGRSLFHSRKARNTLPSASSGDSRETSPLMHTTAASEQSSYHRRNRKAEEQHDESEGYDTPPVASSEKESHRHFRIQSSSASSDDAIERRSDQNAPSDKIKENKKRKLTKLSAPTSHSKKTSSVSSLNGSPKSILTFIGDYTRHDQTCYLCGKKVSCNDHYTTVFLQQEGKRWQKNNTNPKITMTTYHCTSCLRSYHSKCLKSINFLYDEEHIEHNIDPLYQWICPKCHYNDAIVIPRRIPFYRDAKITTTTTTTSLLWHNNNNEQSISLMSFIKSSQYETYLKSIIGLTGKLDGCGICGGESSQRRMAIICDNCDREFHLSCLRINTATTDYELPYGNWFCPDCLDMHICACCVLNNRQCRLQHFDINNEDEINNNNNNNNNDSFNTTTCALENQQYDNTKCCCDDNDHDTSTICYYHQGYLLRCGICYLKYHPKCVVQDLPLHMKYSRSVLRKRYQELYDSMTIGLKSTTLQKKNNHRCLPWKTYLKQVGLSLSKNEFWCCKQCQEHYGIQKILSERRWIDPFHPYNDQIQLLIKYKGLSYRKLAWLPLSRVRVLYSSGVRKWQLTPGAIYLLQNNNNNNNLLQPSPFSMKSNNVDDDNNEDIMNDEGDVIEEEEEKNNTVDNTDEHNETEDENDDDDDNNNDEDYSEDDILENDTEEDIYNINKNITILTHSNNGNSSSSSSNKSHNTHTPDGESILNEENDDDDDEDDDNNNNNNLISNHATDQINNDVIYLNSDNKNNKTFHNDAAMMMMSTSYNNNDLSNLKNDHIKNEKADDDDDDDNTTQGDERENKCLLDEVINEAPNVKGLKLISKRHKSHRHHHGDNSSSINKVITSRKYTDGSGPHFKLHIRRPQGVKVQWLYPNRVLASRICSRGTYKIEFLVKWGALTYDEASWETLPSIIGSNALKFYLACTVVERMITYRPPRILRNVKGDPTVTFMISKSSLNECKGKTAAILQEPNLPEGVTLVKNTSFVIETMSIQTNNEKKALQQYNKNVIKKDNFQEQHVYDNDIKSKFDKTEHDYRKIIEEEDQLSDQDTEVTTNDKSPTTNMINNNNNNFEHSETYSKHYIQYYHPSSIEWPYVLQRRRQRFTVPGNFVPYTERPSFLDKHFLYDYQLEGINWLRFAWEKRRSVILADEMGLGKTIQVISFLGSLWNDIAIQGPFLIIAPLATLEDVWIRELQHWAPFINVVAYFGNPESRQLCCQYELFSSAPAGHDAALWIKECFQLDIQREYDREFIRPRLPKLANKDRFAKFDALVTSYEIFRKDHSLFKQINWKVIVVDEGHRLKSFASEVKKGLEACRSEMRLLLTGTPLQNTIDELFSLLNVLHPEKFPESSKDKYQDVTQESVIEQLKTELQAHILRRTKKDVMGGRMPEKKERLLLVENSPCQKEIYKSIIWRNHMTLGSTKPCIMTNNKKNVRVASLRNIVMQLRKCCNHPYLFDEATPVIRTQEDFDDLVSSSGKMILLNRMLTLLKQDGHRVLIFSQFMKMLDILEEYMSFKQYGYERLDGSTVAAERQRAIDRFNIQPQKKFIFLLSTRAGGLGINLTSADTVIIFDSDWNPHNDLQAQARAHRLGQTKKVAIFRFMTRASVEERIIEIARNKLVLDQVVAGKISPRDVETVVRCGAKELFDESSTGREFQYDDTQLQSLLDRRSDFSNDDDDDEEEDRSTFGTNSAHQSSVLDAFKVAHFEETPGDQTEQEDYDSFWSELFQHKPETSQKTENLITKDALGSEDNISLGRGMRARREATYYGQTRLREGLLLDDETDSLDDEGNDYVEPSKSKGVLRENKQTNVGLENNGNFEMTTTGGATCLSINDRLNKKLKKHKKLDIDPLEYFALVICEKIDNDNDKVAITAINDCASYRTDFREAYPTAVQTLLDYTRAIRKSLGLSETLKLPQRIITGNITSNTFSGISNDDDAGNSNVLLSTVSPDPVSPHLLPVSEIPENALGIVWDLDWLGSLINTQANPRLPKHPAFIVIHGERYFLLTRPVELLNNASTSSLSNNDGLTTSLSLNSSTVVAIMRELVFEEISKWKAQSGTAFHRAVAALSGSLRSDASKTRQTLAAAWGISGGGHELGHVRYPNVETIQKALGTNMNDVSDDDETMVSYAQQNDDVDEKDIIKNNILKDTSFSDDDTDVLLASVEADDDNNDDHLCFEQLLYLCCDCEAS